MKYSPQPQNRLDNTRIRFSLALIIASALATGLAGCTMFENKEPPVYLASKTTPPLVIPDSLQLPYRNREYDIPAQEDSSAAKGKTDLDDLKKLERPPAIDSALLTAADAAEAEAIKEPEGEALIVRTARNTEGYGLLVVETDFDNCWERTGVALKKMGFKIEDSDQDNQVYVVYQEINREMTEDEKFLRPRGDKGPRETYQVRFEDRDTQTRIAIHNQGGKADDSALAKHLLTQLRAMLEKPQ